MSDKARQVVAFQSMREAPTVLPCLLTLEVTTLGGRDEADSQGKPDSQASKAGSKAATESRDASTSSSRPQGGISSSSSGGKAGSAGKAPQVRPHVCMHV